MKLRFADQEIRLTQDPFPLYPGEKIITVSTQTVLCLASNQSSRFELLERFLLFLTVPQFGLFNKLENLYSELNIPTISLML